MPFEDENILHEDFANHVLATVEISNLFEMLVRTMK